MPRLLFDEQLSEELCEAVADIFPGSLHVRLLGQGGAPDATVWDLARERGYLIVSKDEDFHRLAVLRGAPPKFVWIRLATVRQRISRDSCGDVTTTSAGSVSNTTRRCSNSGDHDGRPNKRVQPTAADATMSRRDSSRGVRPSQKRTLALRSSTSARNAVRPE